jgi:hypothetical protein
MLPAFGGFPGASGQSAAPARHGLPHSFGAFTVGTMTVIVLISFDQSRGHGRCRERPPAGHGAEKGQILGKDCGIGP